MISKLLKKIREVRPTYRMSDFNGLQVIENSLLKPHEVVIMVGSEIARQLKAEVKDGQEKETQNESQES